MPKATTLTFDHEPTVGELFEAIGLFPESNGVKVRVRFNGTIKTLTVTEP